MAWQRMSASWSERGLWLQQQRALEHEERLLGFRALAAAIAHQGAAGTHHAMAGNEDRDRIAPAGAAHVPGVAANGLGDLAIGPGLAIGDFQHGLPDLAVELAALRREGQFEMPEPAEEVAVELG